MWNMNTNLSFFIENEKWKNGCSFSIFHFPLKMESGNNGMYTDRSPKKIIENSAIR